MLPFSFIFILFKSIKTKSVKTWEKKKNKTTKNLVTFKSLFQSLKKIVINILDLSL